MYPLSTAAPRRRSHTDGVLARSTPAHAPDVPCWDITKTWRTPTRTWGSTGGGIASAAIARRRVGRHRPTIRYNAWCGFSYEWNWSGPSAYWGVTVPAWFCAGPVTPACFLGSKLSPPCALMPCGGPKTAADPAATTFSPASIAAPNAARRSINRHAGRKIDCFKFTYYRRAVVVKSGASPHDQC